MNILIIFVLDFFVPRYACVCGFVSTAHWTSWFYCRCVCSV